MPKSINLNEASISFPGGTLVGRSTIFQELIRHVALIKDLQAPLFLYGPAGTGKSLLAHYVHYSRSKEQGTYLELPCTETLEARQLTEAIALVEDLPFATLYLKGIEFLPSATQQHLITLLPNIKKTKLIASGSTCLFSLMQARQLDPAILYFFSSTPVEIPALVERGEDIELLAHYFLSSHHELTKKSDIQKTIHAIKQRRWNNNIRGLKDWIDEFADQGNVCTGH